MAEGKKYRSCSWLVFVLFIDAVVSEGYEFINPIRFPYSNIGNPYVGVILAIALPIDLRGPADLFFSANFESSYALPSNQSELSYPPLISSTRGMIYQLLESKISGYGYPGKPCLKRAVCEVAEITTKNTGVLGDIIHILLTPSSSTNETGLEAYAESEHYGKKKGHCKKFKKKCPYSILNLYSAVKNVYNMYDPVSFKNEMSLI